MTTFPSNPNTQPSGPDESDLLALIEGTPIPAERAARLRECLANDPRLAELAALMRADRDAVASLPEVSAPADLLDRVEMLLEREALVGLARSEATAASHDLPVSAVIPARRPWPSMRYGAPLAAAAAVLLIAGGVLMLIPGKRPALIPGPITGTDPTIGSGHTTDIARGNPTKTTTNEHDTNDPAPVPPVVVATGPQPDAPTVTPGTDTTPAASPAIAKAAPTIEPEKLLAAAADGRLVLRLRAAPDKVIGRVEALRGNTRAIHVETMTEGQRSLAARAYVEAWSARPMPAELIKPVPSLPEPGPLASNTPGNAPRPEPSVSRDTTPSMPREADPILSSQAYIAAVPATVDGLEALRNALGNKLVPADWQILPAPLALDAPADASSVLWWTSPPTAWARRFSVPIVVQSN